MSARNAALMGTLWDVGLFLFQLAHALLVGFFVDAAGNGETLKKGVAIYLPCIHGSIVLYLLWMSYMKIGTKNAARKNPETLFGIFSEILNITLFFGVLYNCARVWSKPSTDPFHQAKFLDSMLIAIYDSSMIQAGKYSAVNYCTLPKFNTLTWHLCVSVCAHLQESVLFRQPQLRPSNT